VALTTKLPTKVHKLIDKGAYKTFEYVSGLVGSGSSKVVVVVVVYRLGSSPPKSDFFLELENLIEILVVTCDSFIIAGDINIRLDRPTDNLSVQLLNMLTVYDLLQHVTVVTHTFGGLLDVVITRQRPACGILQIPVVTNVGISDHYLVKWSTTIQT